jgi:hypothetical protein
VTARIVSEKIDVLRGAVDDLMGDQSLATCEREPLLRCYRHSASDATRLRNAAARSSVKPQPDAAEMEAAPPTRPERHAE